MADNHFDMVMVWDHLGSSIRIKPFGTAQVLDPATNAPVTVVQNGQSSSVVTADGTGRAAFVAQQGLLKLVSGGLVQLITSPEAATQGAANAAAAQAAQAAAEAAAKTAQSSGGTTNASLLTSGTVDPARLPVSVPQFVNGGIGLNNTNPVNAALYIGSGTGTLTDNPRMGLKVKIDTPTGQRPDGIQSDVNIVAGAGNGSVRAIVGRVDLNDTVSTGDTVALWGDAWITSASPRNTWGANIYGSIRPGIAYPGTMMGCEIGWENQGTLDNTGGGLHVVSHGTGAKGAFGVMISSDPSFGAAQTFKTNLLMRTENGPSDNFIWIGTAPSNAPSGTPLFQIDKNGKVGIGQVAGTTASVRIGNDLELGSTLAGTTPAITIKRATDTFPTVKIGASGGEIDFGNGTADTDVYVKRGGSAVAAAGPALWVGTATGSGAGYMQLWQQSVAPSVASTKALRLFAQDNGSGKTQLCVKFPTGGTIVLATEV